LFALLRFLQELHHLLRWISNFYVSDCFHISELLSIANLKIIFGNYNIFFDFLRVFDAHRHYLDLQHLEATLSLAHLRAAFLQGLAAAESILQQPFLPFTFRESPLQQALPSAFALQAALALQAAESTWQALASSLVALRAAFLVFLQQEAVVSTTAVVADLTAAVLTFCAEIGIATATQRSAAPKARKRLVRIMISFYLLVV
jgi:hypothetical protein